MSSSPPLPKLPGGPDPSRPVPRTPVEGIDLATYARVAARLAERAESRSAVLASAGLDDARWLAVEQTWLLRVAIASLQNDLELLRAYEEATLAGQDALPMPPMPPLEVYADLLASIEAGQDPAVVLARAGMSVASFGRVQRAWSAKLAADPTLAAALRALRRANPRG